MWIARSRIFRHRRHAAIQEDGNGISSGPGMNYGGGAMTDSNAADSNYMESVPCVTMNYGRSKARECAVLFLRVSDFGPIES